MAGEVGNTGQAAGPALARARVPSHFVALLASIGFGIAGQLLMKRAALLSIAQPDALASVLALALALGIYSIGVAHWIYALRGVRLSVAYSLAALNYAGVLAGSALWFGETITPLRIAGVGLIFAGVLMVVLPGRRTAGAAR